MEKNMSNPDDYQYPTYYLHGITSPGTIDGDINNPVLIESVEATGTWTRIYSDSIRLSEGVRINNVSGATLQVQFGRSTNDFSDEGYYLPNGEDIFIETPYVNYVFVKGGGTASFIAT